MGIIQNPLAGMQGDDQMTRFVGVLERRCLLLTAQELRFRALLESLTGEPWDDNYADLDQAEMDGLVERSLMQSLAISKEEAASMVVLNRSRANAKNLLPDADGNTSHIPAHLR